MTLNSLQIKQLNNMNAAAQRAQLGNILGAFSIGDIFYLNPTSGSDSFDGKSADTAKATLEAAYALLVDGHNDVLVYVPGTTGLILSEGFEWAKSYSHFVGMSAPSRVAQRARIFQLSTATGVSPLFLVSGSGCIFQNLYIFQGVADATSLVNVEVTGNRNVFSEIHFAGGGNATQAVDGGASCLINGGSENLFERCVFGVDTIAAGNGMAGLVFAATGGAARNRFMDCDFTMYAGNAGAVFVEILGNSGIDRYQEFVNPKFINTSGTAMTQAFSVAAGVDPANKKILLSGDYAKLGCTKWDNADKGVIMGRLAATSAADTVGDYTQIIS